MLLGIDLQLLIPPSQEDLVARLEPEFSLVLRVQSLAVVPVVALGEVAAGLDKVAEDVLVVAFGEGFVVVRIAQVVVALSSFLPAHLASSVASSFSHLASNFLAAFHLQAFSSFPDSVAADLDIVDGDVDIAAVVEQNSKEVEVVSGAVVVVEQIVYDVEVVVVVVVVVEFEIADSIVAVKKEMGRDHPAILFLVRLYQR
jgi:hypothetical protein